MHHHECAAMCCQLPQTSLSKPASTTPGACDRAAPGQCYWISAPALSEVMAPRRYFDVCSIARSQRELLDVRYPAEGTRRAPDRPAQPADPVPPVEPPPGEGRDRAPLRGAKVRRHATWRLRATARERRQLRPFCTAWTIGCAAEWRRGVGRQARQGGGGNALMCMCFLNCGILETVQVSCTPLSVFNAVEDCRTAPLFDRPEKHSSRVQPVSLQHVRRQSPSRKPVPAEPSV